LGEPTVLHAEEEGLRKILKRRGRVYSTLYLDAAAGKDGGNENRC
jgi:hypothetical protein